MDRGELYHVGIVVPDLESARDELGRAYGLQWGRPREGSRRVRHEGDLVDITFRTCFSVEAPHLEIIEAVPDTLWTEPSGSAIHHLGFWVDDVATAVAGLEDAGSPMAACGVGADGEWPVRFAYHRDPRGFFVEVVTSAVRAEMEARWQPVD